MQKELVIQYAYVYVCVLRFVGESGRQKNGKCKLLEEQGGKEKEGVEESGRTEQEAQRYPIFFIF